LILCTVFAIMPHKAHADQAVRVCVEIAVRDRRVPIGWATKFCPAATAAGQNRFG
jgi:hypothetical protein